jgi:hypothetical protein
VSELKLFSDEVSNSLNATPDERLMVADFLSRQQQQQQQQHAAMERYRRFHFFFFRCCN